MSNNLSPWLVQQINQATIAETNKIDYDYLFELISDYYNNNDIKNLSNTEYGNISINSQGVQDGTWEWDVKNKKLYISTAWLSILGFENNHVESNLESIKKYILPEDLEMLEQIFEQQLKERLTEKKIIRFVGKDQLLSYIMCKSHVICDNQGNVVKILGFYTDVTDLIITQQQIEEARKKAETNSRLKSDFLANMSHEIRTPMNAIIGMTGLLLDTELDTQQRNWSEIVKNSADALLEIINDILDYSKIDSGNFILESKSFNLFTLIEEIVDLLSFKAKEKEIELMVLYPKIPNPNMIGDSGRIRQIIINLVGNAIKFTSEGYVLIDLSQTSIKEDKVSLVILIKDTGVGIPEDKFDYIFDKFTQAEESTSRKFGGTGLGLAISKKLIELMSGRISVESVLGQGSIFSMHLSLEQGENEKIEETAPVSLEQLRGVRVLIVDDSSINRMIMIEYIKDRGLIYEESHNAENALIKIKEAKKRGIPYDIVVTDYILNKLTGKALAKNIKTDPELKETIVMMITSGPYFNSNASKLDLKEVGVSALLIRPVHPWQLVNMIAVLYEAKLLSKDVGFLTKHNLVKAITTKDVLMKEKLPDLSSIKVLVVEDILVNQLLMSNILKKINCKPDLASDGNEAVEMAKVKLYDIIFMDCHMPEKDGFEATKEIRQYEEKSGNHSIIIALTADAMEGDREKCLAIGMDDYMFKPVKPDKIIKMMLKYVRIN